MITDAAAGFAFRAASKRRRRATPAVALAGERTATSAASARVDGSATAFVDYFRCPAPLVPLDTSGELSANEGYFRFRGAICYGRRSGGEPARHASGALPDVSAAVESTRGGLRLPFDLSEVVTNLRQERYRHVSDRYLERVIGGSAIRSAYYFFRPLLPVRVRKYLQRARLAGWARIGFPRWPIDITVETLMREVMALSLRHGTMRRIPFIWFWPDGAAACAMMTHDVEGPAGEAFCDRLMDVDDAFGIKSSFQVIPEARRKSLADLVDGIRRRGFEVNIHDLSHDGHLFHRREEFLRRVAHINRYAREFECRGFRSGAMYREQDWYEALDVTYDMSVPSAAHLEPQQGGCCTVMPYFVGNVLELPLTTIQDYSLFHIMGRYSTDLWKDQIALLLSQNGLMSFITHPDYLSDPKALSVYRELLAHLRQLQSERDVWLALPGAVADWWRSRCEMRLVPDGGSWRIEGPNSRRARLAYATLENDRVVYTVDPLPCGSAGVTFQ